MSTSIRLTLYGMMQYLPSLLDGIILPDGMTAEYLQSDILYSSGDLYPYCQVSDELKNLITVWAAERLPQWTRAYNALFADYNPIDNYNRLEEYEDRPDIIRTNNYSDRSSTDSNTDNMRSGFDSDVYVPNSKTAGSSNSNAGGASTNTERGIRTSTTKVSGNIGVTTTQKMINSEIELRKISLYKDIVAEFEQEFIVQIY